MVVVAHQNPGVEPPTFGFANLTQAFQKALARSRILENPRTEVSPVQYVVTRSSILDSDFPRHENNIAELRGLRKKNMDNWTDPFSCL